MEGMMTVDGAIENQRLLMNAKRWMVCLTDNWMMTMQNAEEKEEEEEKKRSRKRGIRE